MPRSWVAFTPHPNPPLRGARELAFRHSRTAARLRHYSSGEVDKEDFLRSNEKSRTCDADTPVQKRQMTGAVQDATRRRARIWIWIVFGHVIFRVFVVHRFLCSRVSDLQRLTAELNSVFCVFVFGTRKEDTKIMCLWERVSLADNVQSKDVAGSAEGRVQNVGQVTRGLTANKSAEAH
jgi:hypothetical protein